VNRPNGNPARFEFETFGAAVGSAVICGALSVLVPTLIAATATLVALALAGWLSLARRRGVLTRQGLGRGPIAAMFILGGAGVGFVAPPSFLLPFRGLLLAGGLLPLFVVGRSPPGIRWPVFSRP
jgi:hypothetical protein